MQAGRQTGRRADGLASRQAGRQMQKRWPLTWRSDRAFFMDAVPLKATTMVLWLQPIRQRVSSCSSQNSSLSVRWYSPRAVRRARVVLSAWGRGVGGSLLVLGDMLRREVLRGLCAAPCKYDIRLTQGLGMLCLAARDPLRWRRQVELVSNIRIGWQRFADMSVQTGTSSMNAGTTDIYTQR